jgi:hypothetical protein
MLVANDDEGWWCAKESEQLNVMTDIAKLSRGVERAAAKDLTPLVLKLQYANYHDTLRAPWRNRLLRR